MISRDFREIEVAKPSLAIGLFYLVNFRNFRKRKTRSAAGFKNGSPRHSQENRVSSTFYVVDTIEFLAKPRFKDKAFLHQKYVVERLSSEQIAVLCFSSRPTISKYLKLYRIPLRKHEERLLLNKGQLALGERRWKGTIQQNKTEAEVVKTIVGLRIQEYSYRQIAAWLDAKGIKTKNERGLWQAATVMKIFKRQQAFPM